MHDEGIVERRSDFGSSFQRKLLLRTDEREDFVANVYVVKFMTFYCERRSSTWISN